MAELLRKRQMVYKPGSVPRIIPWGAVIHLGHPLPDDSCNLPGQLDRNSPSLPKQYVAPIWSCSGWGLPCRGRYRPRGALLPHPFTLT